MLPLVKTAFKLIVFGKIIKYWENLKFKKIYELRLRHRFVYFSPHFTFKKNLDWSEDIKMYPKDVIGMIYSRIKPQSLDPHAKERFQLYIKRWANGWTNYTCEVRIPRFDPLNFIKWLAADADHSDWSTRVESFQSLYYRLRSRNSFQIY